MQLHASTARPCHVALHAPTHLRDSPAFRVGRCKSACVPVGDSEDTVRSLSALALQVGKAPADHPDNVCDHHATAPPAPARKGPPASSAPIVPTFAVGDVVMGEVTYCGPWGAKVRLLQQPDVVGHVCSSDGPMVQQDASDLFKVHPEHTAAFPRGLVRPFKVLKIPEPLMRNSKRQVQLSAAAVDASLAWQRLQQAAQLSFETQQPLPVHVRYAAANYIRCSALGVAAIVPRSQLLIPSDMPAPEEQATPSSSSNSSEEGSSSSATATSSSSSSSTVLEVIVMELDQDSKRAVLSQRLAAEAAEQRQQEEEQRRQQQSGAVVGQLVTGTVTATGPAYVRVALDHNQGVATLPAENISCFRIFDARNVFHTGDKVVALVASVDAACDAAHPAEAAPTTTTTTSTGGNTWSWSPAATQQQQVSTAPAVSAAPVVSSSLCYAAAPPVQWQLASARAAARQGGGMHRPRGPLQQHRSGADSSQQLVLSTAHLEVEAGDMLYKKEEVFAAAVQQHGASSGGATAAVEVGGAVDGLAVVPGAALAQQLVDAAAMQDSSSHTTTAFAEPTGEPSEEQEWLAPGHQPWQADEQQQWEAEKNLVTPGHLVSPAEVTPVPVVPAPEEQAWCAPVQQPWEEGEQQEWATAGVAAWQPAC